MNPRMHPEDRRYELANLSMLIFIDPNCFETETLRPNASDHMGGRQEEMQPMSPRMPPRGSEAAIAHPHQHKLEAMGRWE